MNSVVKPPGALRFMIEAERDFDLASGHFYYFAVVKPFFWFFQIFTGK